MTTHPNDVTVTSVTEQGRGTTASTLDEQYTAATSVTELGRGITTSTSARDDESELSDCEAVNFIH
jgi:hypothetical protein